VESAAAALVAAAMGAADGKSGVEGKSVELGGRRIIKKKMAAESKAAEGEEAVMGTAGLDPGD
jgi:hypothetical protein